ncbi:methyltransferase [Streptomyces sp. HU2014]|uniref:HemK2/MTQ2 family protein methyltransferase n=1 Tax=Streptomyces sp. HU2014 TaxID=2939414 RepID=UPI00200FA666|nr:HemK2/MTQ2 family protein methyltransferase [Streptomyces sp. HU2014]UQI46753.1 methyltransferase [Streptomyces sp. HU2014]
MWFFRLPGVYAPQEDTAALLEALARERLPRGAAVLDVGTGSGVLAVEAARRRARVVAVDTSRRAVLTTRLNARLAGVRVRALRGELSAAGPEGPFDLVLANPPYVPAPDDARHRRGPRRAWAGGPDGRAVLDRLCEELPDLLRPGARVLIVHSAVSGPERTVRALEKGGLSAEVTSRRVVAFGPVMRGQAAWLRKRGLIGADEGREELVVVRGEYRA